MEATAVVPRAQQQGKSSLWLGVLLAVMGVAGVGAYMTMQRAPGTLVINAADTVGKQISGLEITVDDVKRCDSSPCIVRDVAPGPHLVKVTAPGFDAPAPKAVAIEAQKNATLDLSLVATKSLVGTGVKVSGNQPGARLFVDGKEIGALPQEVKDLEAGDHKIRVAGNERYYAPLEKTVSVGKNEMVDLGNVQLKVLKGKVTFQLGTAGAKVYLVASPTNKKEIPNFPIPIEFDPADRYELVAVAPGFEELRRPITFDDGIAEKSFTIELSPKAMAASPIADKPAVRSTTTSAPADKPVVVADKPSTSTKPQSPAFLQGEGREPAATPTKPEKKDPPAAAGEAFLNINSIPPSSVVLDGKPLGPTPKLKVAVPAGAHTVLFVNAEQSLKKTISVSVGAGETKAAFAKLKE
jgi:serine/threonine-protein kinase